MPRRGILATPKEAGNDGPEVNLLTQIKARTCARFRLALRASVAALLGRRSPTRHNVHAMTSGSFTVARRRRAAARTVRFGAGVVVSMLFLALLAHVASEARAAVKLSSALATVEPADLVPGADRFGPVEGAPPRAQAFEGSTPRGYVFLNTDVAGAVGYSGKPIHLLVGLDTEGTITGAVLHEHREPIVLIGIPERKIKSFIADYVGRNVREFLEERDAGDQSLDIIAGATVTILVITTTPSAGRRCGWRARWALPGSVRRPARRPRGEIDATQEGVDDWMTLIGDGSVRRLNLSVGEVTADFAAAGKEKAAARDPRATTRRRASSTSTRRRSACRSSAGACSATPNTRTSRARLEPGQHALLIAANGLYSFKGSGFVRGGIFDRIQLVQGDGSIRFRDRQYKHLGEVAADLAQPFAEVGPLRGAGRRRV